MEREGRKGRGVEGRRKGDGRGSDKGDFMDWQNQAKWNKKLAKKMNDLPICPWILPRQLDFLHELNV